MDCCLLVYDISRRESFDECKNYYKNKIKGKCKKNTEVLLLGNKTDFEYEREVKYEEGADFATENDYIFMESSCFKNENVADAFETLIEIICGETKKNRSYYIFHFKNCNKRLNKYLNY